MQLWQLHRSSPGHRVGSHLLLSCKLRGDFCGRLHKRHFIFKYFIKTRSCSWQWLFTLLTASPSIVRKGDVWAFTIQPGSDLLLHFSPWFKPRSDVRGLLMWTQSLCSTTHHHIQLGHGTTRGRPPSSQGAQFLLHSSKHYAVFQICLKGNVSKVVGGQGAP